MRYANFSNCFPVVTIVLIFLLAVSNAYAAKLPGRILYIETLEPGKSFLAVINPDGTGKRRLSPYFSNPVLPKAHGKLGLIGITNRTSSLNSEMFFLKPSHKKCQKLMDGGLFHGFSNSGNFFLFTLSDEKSPLMVFSIKQKIFVKMSERRIVSANWSPDDNWIAATALMENGTTDLFLISTKAQGIMNITNTPQTNESFPVFASDGKHIAYITDKYGRSEIEFMNTTNRLSRRPLIVGLYPAVSPDDKWICFESGNQIMISRTNGLDQQVLCSGKTPIWIK
ncbi:MAG: PD40 domain-containing protein [Candidatus Riflebacteria bacterium]|nr:PD40 domain-containing protein [Candidatus Riflebacteria bacterium]